MILLIAIVNASPTKPIRYNPIEPMWNKSFSGPIPIVLQNRLGIINPFIFFGFISRNESLHHAREITWGNLKFWPLPRSMIIRESISQWNGAGDHILKCLTINTIQIIFKKSINFYTTYLRKIWDFQSFLLYLCSRLYRFFIKFFILCKLILN